jgi:hypothetical protein
MEVESEDPGQKRQVPVAAARNHFIIIAIAALGIATGLIIWRALVSPSSPQ